MSNWSEKVVSLENDDEIYSEFLRKTGLLKISHLDLILFGDAMNESFLKKLTIATHIYKAGDKLNKIAFQQYGDPRLWWVIAWFNGKPTDLDCKIGDTLLVPHPLEEVLHQAQSKKTL